MSTKILKKLTKQQIDIATNAMNEGWSLYLALKKAEINPCLKALIDDPEFQAARARYYESVKPIKKELLGHPAHPDIVEWCDTMGEKYRRGRVR